MWELNTSRLSIIPLSLAQFKLLLEGTAKLEINLKLKASNQLLEGHVQQAMQNLYHDALKNPGYYLWYTNWQIVLKSENVSIGSACFKGKADEKGEVEIGYGTDSGYRNRGYMTEAVTAICRWALKQHGVMAVIAETENENIASHRVLEKIGMRKYRESGDCTWWRIERQAFFITLPGYLLENRLPPCRIPRISPGGYYVRPPLSSPI